jgi:micrococcal nuclease
VLERALRVTLLALVIAGGSSAWPAAGCITPSKPHGLPSATVKHVSDGDTVILRFPDGRRERTRLIGLDGPEDDAGEKLERDVVRTGRDRETLLTLGRRASVFTRRLLPQETIVNVEPGRQPRDRHGRLLAYLWRENELVNLIILRDGYAQLLTVSPNVRYADVFRVCRREAREASRGLLAAP